MPTLTRSTFSVEFPEDGIVAIYDHDEGMSVTNDAENVIRALWEHGYINYGDRVIYCDTTQIWDELKHDGKGEFTGFHCIHAKTLDDAIQKVRSK